MKLHTRPVYSALAALQDVPTEVATRLGGWQLSRHQVETYDALIGDDCDIIVNTAMTGDGKSLAAYLPAFIQRHFHAFGMYPTIELSRDQQRQFANYAQHFNMPIPYDALWGSKLTQLMAIHSFKERASALQERFTHYNVILTNPDIFNLVMNFRYWSGIYTEQELPASLDVYFDAFIFDEFHVFSMPQMVAAITAMLYLAEMGQGHKFLFLSATPNLAMIELAQRAGFRCKLIEGTYSATPLPGGTRMTLHPAELSLHALGECETSQDWLRMHVPDIVAFWREQSPRPKGAIIVNSVALARRITQMLWDELRAHKITVGENTGLTDAETRAISRECDIVVGTSTIDVGVDFNINWMAFESTNAGNFLQRFGRLGRNRMNEKPFERYEAHALLSGRTPWIYSKLQEELSKQGVMDNGDVDRPIQLAEAVRAAFTPENEFERYAARWGSTQAAHILTRLESRRSERAYEPLSQALTKRYETLFGQAAFAKGRMRYWGLVREDRKAHCQPILNEVIVFRGSSPFQVACWDASVEPNAFIDYDLLSLIQVADLEVVSPDAFIDAVNRRFDDGLRRGEALDTLEHGLQGTKDTPLVVRVRRFKEERESLLLGVAQSLSPMCDQVFVLTGLGVKQPRLAEMRVINAVLRKQKIVCYATRRDLRALRTMLRLPANFPLQVAEDMYANQRYTLAFGKAALMLDAQLFGTWRKNTQNDSIIC